MKMMSFMYTSTHSHLGRAASFDLMTG